MNREHSPDAHFDALHLLRELLDLDTDVERERFLAARCTDDPDLAERVRAMLRRIGEDEEPVAVAEVDPLVGARLGPFRVAERIGRGGMGVVYRGEREGHDFAQEVALKLIRRGFDFDDIRARFLRERRILARLDHPNLARFIDGSVAPDGRPWFALEFVRGEPLTRWCDAHKLDLRARLRRFLDVCAAVQYAHAQLVVHRDLKPGNILVDDAGHVRLLDFGIARLLGDDDAGATLTAIGGRGVLTPEYAAPEQFGGEAAGVATDVYALGVVAYELVAGTLPYEIDRRDLAAAERTVRERSPQALAIAITRDGAETLSERLDARATTLRGYRRDVRGDLARILDKALAKEPQRRYASVQAFADDLARWLDGAPVRASGNGVGYRMRKFVARNRLAVTLGAAIVAATGLGLAGMAWKTRVATVSAERAQAMQAFVFGLFRSASPMTTPESLPTTEDLLAEGARQALGGDGVSPETQFDMLATIGRIHLDLRRYTEAMPLLRKAVALGESLYGTHDARLLPPLLGLLQAETYQLEINNGKPQDAAGHLKRARGLAAAGMVDEAMRADVALAECALRQATVREAGNGIAECRAAVAAMEALPQPQPGSLAKAYYLSARTLDHAGDHAEESIETARRGLLRVQALGGDTALYDEMTLAAQLSETLASVNRHEEALAEVRHANALAARLFPRPHPDAGKLLFDEASLLRKMGREAEAERKLRQALDVYVPLYGERLTLKSADMYWTRLNLVTSLNGQRKYAESEALVRSMIADVEADPDFRKQRRTVAQLQANLAMALVAQHRLDEAEPMLAPALEPFKANEQGVHLGAVPSRVYGLKASILQKRGQPGEAVAWYELAIAALGEGSSMLAPVAQVRIRLGSALREAGRLDEAVTAGIAARDTLASVFGDAHRGTIEARVELARSLERGGSAQRAAAELDAARTTADGVLAADDPLRAELGLAGAAD